MPGSRRAAVVGCVNQGWLTLHPVLNVFVITRSHTQGSDCYSIHFLSPANRLSHRLKRGYTLSKEWNKQLACPWTVRASRVARCDWNLGSSCHELKGLTSTHVKQKHYHKLIYVCAKNCLDCVRHVWLCVTTTSTNTRLCVYIRLSKSEYNLKIKNP